jgi:hypothetical protein
MLAVTSKSRREYQATEEQAIQSEEMITAQQSFVRLRRNKALCDYGATKLCAITAPIIDGGK